MTILFHAMVGGGLGHLSRLLGIAEAVRIQSPDMPIIFVTESTEGRLLDCYDFPYYQLPRWNAMSSDPRWKNISPIAIRNAWFAILNAIFMAHKPLVVVYDSYIGGLLQVLVRMQESRQVLILRKQKDMKMFFQDKSERLRDLNLLAFPHNKEDIPLDNFQDFIHCEVMFCGPLLRRSRSDLMLDKIRKTYNIRPDEFTVVVSNGGGNTSPKFTDDFIPITLKTLQTVEAELPTSLRIIVITGPLNHQLAYQTNYQHHRIVIRDFEPMLFDLFAAANLVITRGGYNTVLELQEINVPGICIPAHRQSDDQHQRIVQASQVSSNIQLGMLDITSLSQSILDIARSNWWQYQNPEIPDLIAKNKHQLAQKLIALA